MTITENLPDRLPTVVDGEVVYAHADDAPPLNPYRWPVRISAGFPLIAAAGAVVNVDGDTSAHVMNIVAVSIATLLFLTLLFRFNARADAGDR